MTPDPSTSDRRTRTARLPVQLRAAAGVVAAEGALALGVALVVVVRAIGANGLEFRLAEAGYFGLVGAALVAVAVGLFRGRHWARTPAIVAQLLLLPVVYSLIGPSHQLLLGILGLAVVGSAFMLLISEPVRRWWTGEE